MTTPRRLSTKQENFCLNYVKLDFNGTQAVLAAGYKCNADVAKRIASENLTKPDVSARIAELRAEVDRRAKELEEKTIAGKVERMQRLSEMVRTKITDFMELGQDGSWVNIGPETPKTGAIAELHSRTEYDENGTKPTVHTSVKLHDPLKAIDLLNKMDGIYSTETLLPVTVTNFIFRLPDGTKLPVDQMLRLGDGSSNKGDSPEG